MIDGESEKGGRLVTRITVTYRDPADPEGKEETLSVVHSGGGAEVNGVIWSDDLMRKLAYMEDGSCVEPKKITGMDEWKVERTSSSTEVGSDCVWLHRLECDWHLYCPDQ